MIDPKPGDRMDRGGIPVAAWTLDSMPFQDAMRTFRIALREWELRPTTLFRGRFAPTPGGVRRGRERVARHCQRRRTP